MAEKEQDSPMEEETIKAEGTEEKPKPKPKTKSKTAAKTPAKTEAKSAAKTAAKAPAAEKPVEKTPAAAPPPVEPPAAVTPPPAGGNKTLLLAGGAILLGGLAIILLLVSVLFGGGGNKILVGFPDNDWNYDVFLLRSAGQDEDDGLRIGKDLDIDGASLYAIVDGYVVSYIDSIGFVPDSDQIYVSYYDDGDTILEQMRVKDDETTDVFDSDNYFSGYVFLDLDTLFLFEDNDDEIRTYAAAYGEEAERIGKGSGSWISTDGRYLLVVDQDDEEATFSLLDLRNDDETELFTAEDLASYQFSPDGKQVAYVINSDDDEQELHLFDIKSEEDEEVETDYYFPDYGFSSAGDVYYIVENEDGELEGFIYGSDDAIAEGTIMVLAPSPDGDFIITVSGEEEDDLVVSSYSVRKEESVEITDGENLKVAIARDPEQLLISSFADGDLTLYTAKMDGSDLVEMFDERDVISYNVWNVLGHEYFYLTYATDDGTSLMAFPAGGDEPFMLLEEYYSIDLLNVSANGRYVVLAAAEDSGDDEILISIEVKDGGDVLELDDDHETIYNAVFTDNGREILFTASEGYDADEVSVNIVPANGKDSPEELYSEATLIDVQWAILHPFDNLYFSGYTYGYGN